MILTELPRRMEEQETHMEKWMKGRYMANQKRLSVGTGVPAPRGRGIVMLILLALVVALAAVQRDDRCEAFQRQQPQYRHDAGTVPGRGGAVDNA